MCQTLFAPETVFFALNTVFSDNVYVLFYQMQRLRHILPRLSRSETRVAGLGECAAGAGLAGMPYVRGEGPRQTVHSEIRTVQFRDAPKLRAKIRSSCLPTKFLRARCLVVRRIPASHGMFRFCVFGSWHSEFGLCAPNYAIVLSMNTW